jgi:hypothetical protein
VKRIALILVGHLKPEWKKLTEEEQAAFAARVRRTAQAAGVTPIVGYTLTTQGSFLEIWEADEKKRLEVFKQKLDALDYKKYFDEVLMLGERDTAWLNPP